MRNVDFILVFILFFTTPFDAFFRSRRNTVKFTPPRKHTFDGKPNDILTILMKFQNKKTTLQINNGQNTLEICVKCDNQPAQTGLLARKSGFFIHARAGGIWGVHGKFAKY